MDYAYKLSIIRILDSKKERFKLDKAYESKVDIINVVTAPEIEMLIIINENKYNEFSRSRKSPSEFCKSNLKMHNVKKYSFILDYFADAHNLLKAIIKYDSIHKVTADYTIQDLLKPSVIESIRN